MEVVLERCAALDIGKKLVVAAVRTPAERGGRRQLVRSFGTVNSQLIALGAWLRDEGVTDVAMEATGVYWKPIWYALEGDFELMLVNARQVKKVPGRKTDVKDAEWLAQLLECGLLSGSFVPPPVIRELRDLTRYRTRLVQDGARETLRVQKVLEDAGIKLSSVATETLGVSGRAMIEALIAGERDPEVLADLAQRRLRKKIPQLREALVGRFTAHHALMLRSHLDHLDFLAGAIRGLDDRVDEAMAPFAEARDRLVTIPGVGRRTAEVIIAEIGADMGQFPTSGHLASWAGVCPGNNESAGKRLSGTTRKGDRWLRAALTECAWAAHFTTDTYLGAQFWHIARRRGQKKAAIAVAHTILVIVWHLLSDPSLVYQDLGSDHLAHRVDPQRKKQSLIRQLEALGLKVHVEPLEAA
jgi:transposase